MAVGRSGMGKTTLVNTLFSSQLATTLGRHNADEPAEKTTEIKVHSHLLAENNVRLNINVIDTPGFGDQINNEKCWDLLVKYIKEQHSQYLRKELSAQRPKHIPDSRVHCILYFIPPSSGSGLKALDVQALKRLSEIANVVPIIAKSDSLTLSERATLKKVLQNDFIKHNLNIYPYDSEDLSKDERQLNEDIKSLIPFAVVGSDHESEINGEVVRCRKSKWGAINIEDVSQCEFVFLRDFLTRTHLQDLVETTALTHYESFRSKQLIALKENANNPNRQSVPGVKPHGLQQNNMAAAGQNPVQGHPQSMVNAVSQSTVTAG
ncbi:cell division/GTP binding protein [Metschnikowia bicuspidata var. bicuspidata NRRL YB-4993]|uniref:Cell division/GTP binding protein n=1 Tax=Metschnikowia bicuspidata var. bicuspidata NRRL YB-4993 TaxID=869754 RepID=A0A1A0HCU8_9ASCO|nr:cell division/GTP binding protein [Metschnikowia bicuspidata var. bicuspidata NRRL YB-4993]OBA21826.1 cell division/GTP binding protein [Metschnikowia bicuspidata var. bicuspidata NRRL YB-4993]